MGDSSEQGHSLVDGGVSHRIFLNGSIFENNETEIKVIPSADLPSPVEQPFSATTFASNDESHGSNIFLTAEHGESNEERMNQVTSLPVVIPNAIQSAESLRRVEQQQQIKEEIVASTLAMPATRRGSPRLTTNKIAYPVAESTSTLSTDTASSPASSTLTRVSAGTLPPTPLPTSKQPSTAMTPQSSSRTSKRTGRTRSTESPGAMSPEERESLDIMPGVSGNAHKRSAKEIDDDDYCNSDIEATPSSKKAKTSKSSMSKEQERRASKRISTGIIVISQDESTKTNNDYCETCKGLGKFLCCDSCPRAFHFSCVEPPIDITELDKMDNWYCNVCRCDKKPPPKSAKGLFEKLMDNLNRMNPQSFELPKEVREFFKGVASNKQGEYVDAAEVKAIKYGKNGLAEEPDYMRLKDKNGGVVLCYKCGKSALKGPIIPCDHCALYWHMDCLDPPMTNPPSQTKKWMCPNHVEHVMPKKRKRKDFVVVDPQDPYNIPNDGNIEVINDPEETATESDQEIISQRERLELSFGGVTYRLPERAIKLNFMDSIRSNRERMNILRTSSHSAPSPASSLTSTAHETINNSTHSMSSSLHPNGPIMASSSLTISPLSSPSSSISSLELTTPPRSRMTSKLSKEIAALHDHQLNTVQENEEQSLKASSVVTDEELQQWLGGLSALQRDMANHPRMNLNENQDSSQSTEYNSHQYDDYNMRMLLRAAMAEQSTERVSRDDLPSKAMQTAKLMSRSLEDAEDRHGKKNEQRLIPGMAVASADWVPILSEDDPRYKQYLLIQSLMRVKGEEALLAFLMGP